MEEIYLVVSIVMCVAIIVTVIADLVVKIKGNKNDDTKYLIIEKEENQKVEQPVEEVKEEPVEEVVEEVVNEPTDEQPSEDGFVKFNSQLKTLKEKYEELDEAGKANFDKLDLFVSEIPDIKKSETSKHVEYRFGRVKIVKLSIKRKTVIAECFVVNSEIDETLSKSKTRKKMGGIEFIIDTPEDVETVITMINVNVESYKELLEARKQKRREARRQKKAE